MASIDGALFSNKIASAQIKAGSGTVYGVIVNSHTAGTMKLWDALTATGTVIVNTFTFAAGSGVYTFPQAINFNTGLFFTLGGTADVTFLFN